MRSCSLRSGAHFDGGSLGGACKLTSILYVNEGWVGERDGGRLLMLDEPHGCWRSVTPHAGRVVFFLCESTLHKVEPCLRERFALTSWWNVPNGPMDRTVCIRAAVSSGPGRYTTVPSTAKHDVLQSLEAVRRQSGDGDGPGGRGAS